jgi:DNA-binding MarR family transcriptional regulator
MLVNGSNFKFGINNTLSSNAKNDFISGLQGRMILTLVEIALQYPDETNHASLRKILSIPPSTLSNQIKKLIQLDYLEFSNTPRLLYDARYRNFRITSRGISFLQMLKDVLDSSIRKFEDLPFSDPLKERLDENLTGIYL